MTATEAVDQCFQVASDVSSRCVAYYAPKREPGLNMTVGRSHQEITPAIAAHHLSPVDLSSSD